MRFFPKCDLFEAIEVDGTKINISINAPLAGLTESHGCLWSIFHSIMDLPRLGKYVPNRDRPRFFDQVGHQTTNASIGNRHFFTK